MKEWAYKEILLIIFVNLVTIFAWHPAILDFVTLKLIKVLFPLK